MGKDSARLKAIKLLGKTFSEGGYSNIILDKALEQSDMEEVNKAFCTALYYGVLERKITLDHIITQYSKYGLDEIEPDVLNVLRTGIYQLKYMDSVPDSAAVNESVKAAKKLKYYRLSGFVNAVLRSFIRDDKQIKTSGDRYEELSLKYSAPVWLVKLLLDGYSERKAISLLESSLNRPPVTIRLNNLKGDKDTLLSELSEFEPKETPIEGCYEITKGDIKSSEAFKKGYFHVQDISSQLCSMALNPRPGQVILDMCSAPGGKAFTMAELANDSAEIHAYDIHLNRVELIKEGAERLGINSIQAQTRDAAEYDPTIPMADKILCDVPCSGLGVIRRKPEIKYKNPEEFEKLPAIQLQILETAAKYLKPGGELIYSTCTINRKENGSVIDKFLRSHQDFESVSFLEELGSPFGDYEATIFPDNFGSDGFFISKIRKKRQ